MARSGRWGRSPPVTSGSHSGELRCCRGRTRLRALLSSHMSVPISLPLNRLRAWMISIPIVLTMLFQATLAAAAPGQVDPQVAAIQSVIQQANQAQSQALASGDPSVMSATATAAYYRQLMQTNQALIAQGATSIELIQLTWGPISIA